MSLKSFPSSFQEQRPAFRFRLPWLMSAAPAPAPAPARAARPTTDIQIPSQPTTTTPVVRPLFRPAGVAPPPPPPPPPRVPPQVQAPPRTESQPSSPSRFGTQTRVSSQPSSPVRAAAQTQAASQPPPPPPPPPPQVPAPPRTESQPSSPSRFGAQTRVSSQPTSSLPPPQVQEPPKTESQTSSPSRSGVQARTSSQPAALARAAAQARVASQPQSPVRVVPPPRASSQPSSPARPNPRVASQASSPSRSTPQPRSGSTPQPQPPSQITSQPRSPSRLGNQSRTEPVAQLPTPKAVEPTSQDISQPLSISKKEPSKSVVSQPLTLETEPDIKPLKESKAKPMEKTDEKEMGKVSVEPKKNAVIELLTEASSRLKAKMKEQPDVQVQEKQIENQENLETKEKAPYSSKFIETQTKPIIPQPKDRSPRQKPSVSSGQRVPLHKEIKDDISKFVNKMAIGHTKHNMGEGPFSVITIAGDNRGAFMHLASDPSSKKERSVHIHRAYKLNPDESTEFTTDGEESSKGRKDTKNKEEEEEEVKKSYINSNTQGVNNSMVFNSTITERNPGVHLVISHNSKDAIKASDRTESLSRAESNITPSQKLTYKPSMRRRCLRGLFLEPSDSETDNPDKPRRHGCRYVCGEKSSKDDIVHVL